MTNPLHAPFYADHACQETVTVVENVPLARDTYRVRFDAPRIAKRIVPGQFIMLRLPGCDDPLLGRPLALYDTVLSRDGQPVGLDLVYLVVGKLTTRLSKLSAGAPLEVWGPLGNGFAPLPTEHLLMVAGGIGQTPFLALAQEYLGLRRYGDPARSVSSCKVTLCYGARSADYLAGVDDFARLGVRLEISTDDGSLGHHGFVSDLLPPIVAGDPNCRIVCCGPEPMMHAVARFAAAHRVACQVSLETPMACGIGICFSCVTKVRDQSGTWDYRRTCVEGPIFDAQQIEW